MRQRFRERGFETSEILVVTQENFENPNVAFKFPDFNDYDVLIPLGAPWGAWDDACIGNWLTPELEWIRSAIEAGKPVFGICFGGPVDGHRRRHLRFRRLDQCATRRYIGSTRCGLIGVDLPLCPFIFEIGGGHRLGTDVVDLQDPVPV